MALGGVKCHQANPKQYLSYCSVQLVRGMWWRRWAEQRRVCLGQLRPWGGTTPGQLVAFCSGPLQERLWKQQGGLVRTVSPGLQGPAGNWSKPFLLQSACPLGSCELLGANGATEHAASTAAG